MNFNLSKSLIMKRKLTIKMTDLRWYHLKKMHVHKLQHFKKLIPFSIQFDTFGILSLTKKQPIHRHFSPFKKIYCNAFYRLKPLPTRSKKNRMNSWTKCHRNSGEGTPFETLCYHLKIVQS